MAAPGPNIGMKVNELWGGEWGTGNGERGTGLVMGLQLSTERHTY